LYKYAVISKLKKSQVLCIIFGGNFNNEKSNFFLLFTLILTLNSCNLQNTYSENKDSVSNSNDEVLNNSNSFQKVSNVEIEPNNIVVETTANTWAVKQLHLPEDLGKNSLNPNNYYIDHENGLLKLFHRCYTQRGCAIG